MTSLAKQYPGIVPPIIGANSSNFGQSGSSLGPVVFLGNTVLTRPNDSTPYAQNDAFSTTPLIRVQNVNRYVGGSAALGVRGNFKTTNRNAVFNVSMYFWDQAPAFSFVDNQPVAGNLLASDLDDYVGGGASTLSVNFAQFQIGSNAALRLHFPLSGFTQVAYNGPVRGRDLWILFVVSNAYTPAPLDTISLDFFTSYTS